ncbi:hypothetical protein EH165_13900 [Nakamurella antarctica]|uniref:Uncharacterized protein n=1 Tax=Nakamurella antarctica TaxID=1902245 RepID=A0A3G8ZZV2_9ACTN|nr:hypothetical protein [Nakamurella antarctica]AZI59071.1 hypothetical protein EH165_13900 [Nakamurella antarctica]
MQMFSGLAADPPVSSLSHLAIVAQAGAARHQRLRYVLSGAAASVVAVVVVSVTMLGQNSDALSAAKEADGMQAVAAAAQSSASSAAAAALPSAAASPEAPKDQADSAGRADGAAQADGAAPDLGTSSAAGAVSPEPESQPGPAATGFAAGPDSLRFAPDATTTSGPSSQNDGSSGYCMLEMLPDTALKILLDLPGAAQTAVALEGSCGGAELGSGIVIATDGGDVGLVVSLYPVSINPCDETCVPGPADDVRYRPDALGNLAVVVTASDGRTMVIGVTTAPGGSATPAIPALPFTPAELLDAARSALKASA